MNGWELIECELAGEQVLSIENDGPRITGTNFWETELARTGAFFVSPNARCVRLLVPPRHANEIVREVRGASEVLIRCPAS